MRAAVLVEQRKPLSLCQVRLPERLGYGQVLVEVAYSGVCGSQIGEIDGIKGEDRYLPHLLGHEGSGKVLEVGSGVKEVRRDDHVVLHWMKGKGIEADPPSYSVLNRSGTLFGKKLNAGRITTFNECAVVSENRLTLIPRDFDMRLAALLGCSVPTGFGIVVNSLKLGPGESIIVFGVGGVGLNVIQTASLVSAYPITAVDRSMRKLLKAEGFGATDTIDTNVLEPCEIAQLEHYDAAIDTTGDPRLIELACAVTKPQGGTIMVGVPKGNIFIYPLPLFFGKILTGFYGGEIDPDEMISRCIGLYERGKLKLRELITDEFGLDEINTAIERVRRGEVLGKCLIRLR